LVINGTSSDEQNYSAVRKQCNTSYGYDQFIDVSLRKFEHHRPEYLALNPNGLHSD
jgi:hypothetical protein